MSDERDELFMKVFYRFYRKVFSYFVRRGFPRTKAEELTQKTLLRVYNSMDGYQGGSNEQIAKAYLMSAARSIGNNELRESRAQRRGGGQVHPSLDDPDRPIDPAMQRPLHGPPPTPPDEAAEQSERLAAIGRAIRKLPDRQRRVLILRIYGLSYREIAMATNASVDAIKKLLFEARKRLKNDLGSPGRGAETVEDDDD